MQEHSSIVGNAPHHGPPRGHSLMIAANPSVSAQTGWPIGCWAAELTHPYQSFVQAGYEVTIASPDGGRVEFDSYSDPTHESGYSADDLITLGFMQQPERMALLANTPRLGDLEPEDYDALFVVGGQSPMYTFRGNDALMAFVAAFYDSGKPTALMCHATSLLLDTRRSSGELLVSGKTWTGFANDEERYADEAVGQRIQPFWIESLARELPDTHFTTQPAFTEYAVRDGNLITGQQQNSGVAAARLVLDAIGAGA